MKQHTVIDLLWSSCVGQSMAALEITENEQHDLTMQLKHVFNNWVLSNELIKVE